MKIAPFLSSVRTFLSVPTGSRRLLVAQYHAFAKQIPLLYFILLVNTWALAITHLQSSPVWLTVYAPGALTLVCLIRISAWIKLRAAVPPVERMLHLLRQTNRVSGVITALFTLWALALYSYGDSFQQSHTAFYMAITVIGCIFCLTHLRSAAIMVAAIVNTVFIVFFASTGNPVFVATSINVLLVSIAMLVILLGNYRDFRLMIAAQEQAEALGNENFKLANSDSLTGLPNRRCFFPMLEQAADKTDGRSGSYSLGMIDLDGFKLINDTFGHSVGDKLLVAVSERLRRLVPQDHFVARLGGDEFALILYGEWSNEQLLQQGKILIAAIEEPVQVGSDTLTVSASIGFATAHDVPDEGSTLLDQADYALYSAKRHARGHAIIFSDEHLHSIVQDKRIERLLRSSNLSNELLLQYQPIVRIPDGEIIGFEALARWNSPNMGLVSPGQFIPIAERSGLIQGVTRLLLGKALAAAKTWPEGLRLSFNLSSKDIGSPEAMLRIMSTVLDSGFNPARIDFEITETAIINDFAQAERSIDALRSLGCGISLDDFGTGYSSLSYLHGLPLNKIKIDRSFVRNLHENPTSLKIVKSLLALSNDMNLECIVEGVETRAEYEKLLEIGCTKIQGYFFSKPVDEILVASYLKNPSRPAGMATVRELPARATSA